MRILFHLGHPAHFHLFKNVISRLENNGAEIYVLIKEKDVLVKLLKNAGLPFTNILPRGKSKGKTGLIKDLLIRGKYLYTFCKKNRPDLLVGTSADISYIGKILGIPSINVNEDDAEVVPLYAWLAYPLATSILSPTSCNNGRWDNKTTKYPGYHELAYLHPDHFKSDQKIISNHINNDEVFFILRFAKLSAHHDSNIKGISDDLALKLVEVLTPLGKVLITSERKLPDKLEPYRLVIDPSDIHHYLAHAKLVISDSQTMSAEAAVLGTPYIRYNDFVGRIGYLEELESKYKLGFGIKPGNQGELIHKAAELGAFNDLKTMFSERKEKMLKDKCNTADFIYNYIVNFNENR